MKNFIKNLFFSAIASITIAGSNASAQSESQCDVIIYNPNNCPSHGYAQAYHPDLGLSNVGTWSGYGTVTAYVFWDGFLSGIRSTHFWARTPTVAPANPAPYDSFYCYDDDWENIGYGHNLTAHLSLHAILIYDEADPE